MSYVVGMKCADGVLLASDKKMTNVIGMRNGYRTHKIEAFDDENMAFCSVGDDLCVTFVQVVREKLGNDWFAGKSFMDLKQAFIDCVGQARLRDIEHRREKRLGLEIRELSGGNTLVVLREHGAVQLWSVETSKAVGYPNPFPIDGCLPLGDAMNPAVFFLNHYYATTTMDRILSLAVHTILMAKNDLTDGIEVGFFTQSEFRILRDDELRDAIETSRKIDEYTSQMLGVFPQ